MLHPRFEGRAEVIKNHVYLVGGDEHKTALERLPRTGNWQGLLRITRARRSYARQGFATAVVADKLYVCGGLRTASVERFDPEVGVWEQLQPMSEERACAAVTISHGQLYMCGGRGHQDRPLCSMERFDPTHNTWEGLAPVMHARVAARVLEIDGRLFVSGGRGAGGASLNSAERFEPATGRWERLPDTTQRRKHLHLAVLSL